MENTSGVANASSANIPACDNARRIESDEPMHSFVGETDLLTDLEISRKREQWRKDSANYRARQRKIKSATEPTTLEIAQRHERWRQARAKLRETKRREKESDASGGCEKKCVVLKPVSSQTQASVMARLREALGPDKLDECICLVCDRTVPRWDAVRVEDEDRSYISKLKRVLSSSKSANDGIPDALVKQYDCSPLARELSGMWLSPLALCVDDDESCRLRWWCMICNECNRSIKRLKMPKFAIANGFFVEQFPSDLDEDLTSMTIPERMLTQLVAVCSMTRVMRGGRNRCIRSHCVVFDSTPGPPVTLLPRSVNDLDCFRVALVGDFTNEQMAKVRRMHTIRRPTTTSAFEFYKEHNHLYSRFRAVDVVMSDEEIEDQDLLFDVVGDNGNLEAEANHEQENVRGLSDNVPVTEEEEVNVVERRTGLLDDTLTMSLDSMVAQAGTTHATDKVRDFLVKRSNRLCEDATRTIFAKMFPHLFPFGRGHPGEHRSVPVSLRECIKYYTTLRSRRFAEDELFVLVAFDRIAMQNMYSQTSFRCQRFPQRFDGYETIDTDSLAKVLLNNERRRRGGSTSRGNDDTVVDRFFKTVDIASCAVWGSNAERMQCRRQAFAYQTCFGQPALFLTLTPNTDNSLVMAHYAGITDVSSAFDLLDAALPSKAELRQASLGNDCISTRLFMRAVDAFIRHALGIDPDSKKKITEGGLFGSVEAYFGMVETQGRGTLHVHFLVWLSDCPRNSAEIEAILLSPNGAAFCESVQEYAKSIVSNDLPLPVESGKCRWCQTSYSKLIGLTIDPHARQDPCNGLFSAEAKKRVEEPYLVQCGGCDCKLSSQHVLRQVLLENRTMMPAWENHLSTTEAKIQARVEAISRNTLQEAIHIVDERERYYSSVHAGVKLETPEMTVSQVTEVLELVNFASLPYRKAADDIFQNDAITRRIDATPPSPQDSRMSPSALDYMVSVLVVLLNQHWWGHTGSCFKASRATHDDSYCRYLYPRERVGKAAFNASGVTIPRKLAHEFINGFNYTVMATFKCNHDIQILLGGTEALDRIYYACKYVTKQQKRLDSVIPIAVAALKRRQEKEVRDGTADLCSTEDKIARSRRRVTSMVYSMPNRQEIAGPLAALYIHLGTCCYSSTSCSKLPLGEMIRQLCSSEEYQCQLVIASTGRGTSNTNATAVSMLDDYICRPKDLEILNVYEFTMKYYRRQSDNPAQSRFPFESGHPLFGTHCLSARQSDAVPLITGYQIPGITAETTREDQVKHAIGSMVLFKRFRTVLELTGHSRPSDEDWLEAYETWKSERSDFVVNIMRNMHDFSFARVRQRLRHLITC
jgi:hypothetical protein